MVCLLQCIWLLAQPRAATNIKYYKPVDESLQQTLKTTNHVVESLQQALITTNK